LKRLSTQTTYGKETLAKKGGVKRIPPNKRSPMGGVGQTGVGGGKSHRVQVVRETLHCREISKGRKDPGGQMDVPELERGGSKPGKGVERGQLRSARGAAGQRDGGRRGVWGKTLQEKARAGPRRVGRNRGGGDKIGGEIPKTRGPGKVVNCEGGN